MGSETAVISIIWALPFILLLGGIALMPFLHKHWWEKHYAKVAICLGVIAASYYFVVVRQPGRWARGMEEYVSFIVLLTSLFVISGGISIRIARKATPLANCTLLLIGAVLSNVLGTTGAAMLLIRPYLRMNRNHLRPYRVIFFIFIVANVGGSLTPIGDPPLFLGYLQGVPFWWVLQHMRPVWLTAVGALLLIFFVIDTIDHLSDKTPKREHEHDGGPQVHILGIHNLLFILIIVAAVFQKGCFETLHEMLGQGFSWTVLGKLLISREMVMVATTIASRLVTPRMIYESHEFSFAPIREVAILFFGIFATMIPAVQYMQQNATRMPLKTPGNFYFGSGVLSSVLDNAPTYLTFLETRLGGLERAKLDQADAELARLAARKSLDVRHELPDDVHAAVTALVRYHEEDVLAGTVSREQVRVAFLLGPPSLKLFIVAISAGSVFWGACTYIGNGPNFMVKSIADASGVQTPGFMRYIFCYTLPILLPLYIAIWAVFFKHAGT